jgi:hypothetical protein
VQRCAALLRVAQLLPDVRLLAARRSAAMRHHTSYATALGDASAMKPENHNTFCFTLSHTSTNNWREISRLLLWLLLLFYFFSTKNAINKPNCWW